MENDRHQTFNKKSKNALSLEKIVLEQYGFTVENVVAKVKAL